MCFMILCIPLKFYVSYPKAAFEEIFRKWMRCCAAAGYKGNERYITYVKYAISSIHTPEENVLTSEIK